ncbi:XkdW family protein [Paenibacillus ferrarius]|uniref:XkdW family protein n=1 Tax=Paenibacillus ferrarius TaxID=1469647 RepID=UPI003D2B67DB
MNIALAIMHLFPQAVPLVDFVVQDDSNGNGPYLAVWNLPNDPPTDEELQAA